jgi:putative ABC transport system permease protein
VRRLAAAFTAEATFAYTKREQAPALQDVRCASPFLDQVVSSISTVGRAMENAMKDWRLIWGALWRKRTRTIFTLLSTVAVFVLFGLAMALRHGLTSKADFPGADLMFVSSTSSSGKLPLAYGDKLARLSGAKAVLPMNAASLYYQNLSNTLGVAAVEPNRYREVFHGLLKFKQGSFRTWRSDRTGALVPVRIAKKYGFKIGQRITLAPVPHSGEPPSSLTTRIDGITDSKFNFGGNLTLHFDYLKTWLDKDTVPVFFVQAKNPRTIAALADRAESLFRNSSVPVKAQPIQAIFQNILARFGDIGTITVSVVGAALFSLLLVIGNTITQSVAERRSEFAVLEALGYHRPRLAKLIVVEAAVLAFGAGLPGLALGWLIIHTVGSSIVSILPGFTVTASVWLAGAALIAVLTAIAAGPGCFMLSRLTTAQALRRG